MSLPRPDAEFQLKFLRELQRILEEGRFTASYKFALVLSLADLAVQRGGATGDPLQLPVAAIAERFTELYWRQAAPWPGGERPEVLKQNTGRRAVVVQTVMEARKDYGDRIDRVRAHPGEWASVTRRVRETVRKMPLLKLQTVGDETREFLYPNRVEGRGRDATITLNPGIGYCFRSFHPLIRELAQGGWAQFVRRMNPELIGERTDLREFLFGASRANLQAVRGPLFELQEGSCFYCRKTLNGETAQVDHFVPWSRYPVDLGHNFVVSHAGCNRRKADHLSAEVHLERWVERNEELSYELASVCESAGVPHDHRTSRQITAWAYGQVEERAGLVWVKGQTLEPLGGGWRGLFKRRGVTSAPPKEVPS